MADDDDFQSSWRSLGRPGPVQKAVKEARETAQVATNRIRSRVSGWLLWLIRSVWDNMEKLVLLVVLLCALGGLGTLFVVSARASGQITWCYVEAVRDQENPKPLNLKGHIDWRQDTDIARVTTVDEAIDIAKKLGCPFHK